jgi:hypothetical protein
MVTEWFHEHENNVNHIPWLSQSPNLNPIEHQREYSTNINRTPNYRISCGRMVSHPSIPPLIKYIPRCIEAVLAHGGPTPY